VALFLGSQKNDVAALTATRELVERLRQHIATAQGEGGDLEISSFLHQLAADFSAEYDAEETFLKAMGRMREDIAAAADAAELPSLLQSARTLIVDEFQHSNSPLAVHEAMNDLMEAVLQRIFALAQAAVSEPWCLLAAGVIGRGEASLSPGLAGCFIGPHADRVAAMVSSLLPSLNLRIDARLLAGGFSWFNSLAEWESAVATLTGSGDERSAALADIRQVAGNADIGKQAAVIAWRGVTWWRQSDFFSAEARHSSGMRLPLGFFGGLKVEKSGAHRGAINMDAQAIGPLVANVRTMAIAAKLTVTGTADRIRELVRSGQLNVDPAGRALEAFHHLQRWKMAAEVAKGVTGDLLDVYVWPERLSPQDHEAFKECLDAIAGIERLVVQNLTGA
jgi:CBS domain-containing protein